MTFKDWALLWMIVLTLLALLQVCGKFVLLFVVLPSIADPPILSSSPENGSATAMQGRLWLAKRSNRRACRVPSLQNVPVRPVNTQSAQSFFWDYLRILKKISITHCSGLLYHMRRLRKEEYLKKTENLDSPRTWRLESQWCVEDTHSAAVWCCSRPMVGLFYTAVLVLADEDKIGGSAICMWWWFMKVLFECVEECSIGLLCKPLFWGRCAYLRPMSALTAPTSGPSALSALGSPPSNTAVAHHAFPDRGVDFLWITRFKETWPHLWRLTLEISVFLCSAERS